MTYKITVKKWEKGNLTRYYLSEGTDSLGYVKEKASLDKARTHP